MRPATIAKKILSSTDHALMSDIELAAFFCLKVSTVRKWRIEKRGPRYIKLGSLVRYRMSDAIAFLESRPSGGEPTPMPVGDQAQV